MKRSDRVLIGMVVVVVVLAVIAGVLGVLARGQEKLLPASDPEGIVQRFLLAMKAKQYTEAYGYFSAKLQKNCAYDDFLAQRFQGEIEEMQVSLQDKNTFDSQAAVTISVTQFRTSGPFLGPFENPTGSFKQTYMLLQEDSQWRFSQIPWPVYWCPTPTPVKPVPSQ